MRDFWADSKPKKINKRKLVISIIIAVILLFFLIIVILYNTVGGFKNWMDKNILNKEVYQDSATTIELEDEGSKVYAYNKYIAVLSKNKCKLYNNFGNKEEELDMEITNPIFYSSSRFVAIAEKDGHRLYVLDGKKIIWDKQIEGNISQICINKNGYVAVVKTGTSYKTVISMFDNNGKELFNQYLSSTRLTDVSISNDNKHLALAEVDTSGVVIQSNVKVISIEKAQSEPTNSLEKVYNGHANSLIINIKYQDSDRLICMYDDSIHRIYDGNDEVLMDYSNQKVMFSSIDLNNNIVYVQEQSSGLFTADSVVDIINVDSKNSKTYTADAVTKEIYTYENVIALNLGSQIEFINTDGWLLKRYIAKQEITNTVISSSVAAIVYRDKVEIINL